MSPQVFIVLATFGSVTAWGLNTLAAFKTQSPAPRFMFFMTSVFAAIYTIAWCVLWVYPEVDRAVWSETLTPASVMTFFTVWCGFPLLELIKAKEVQEEGRRSRLKSQIARDLEIHLSDPSEESTS